MNSRNYSRLALLGILLAGILSASCASILSSSQPPINITSEPAGAEVLFQGKRLGVTPLTHSFRPRTFESDLIVIRKPGYEDANVRLEKTLNSKALFNIIFITTTMGATSWAIDAGTGALVRFSPTDYLIPLKRSATADLEWHNRLSRLTFWAGQREELLAGLARGTGEYAQIWEQYNLPPEARVKLLESPDGLDWYHALQSEGIL